MGVIIQTQRRTPQVLGPNRVIDSVEIGATSTPTGVYFQRVIRYELWKRVPENMLLIMEPIANNIEGLLEQEAVIAAEYVEDLDAAGLVRNLIELTIEYVPPDLSQTGPMTTTITAPVERFATPEGRAVIQGQINEAFNDLVKAATGG